MSLIYPIYTKEELEAMNTPRIASIVGFPYGSKGFITPNPAWLKIWNELRKSDAPRPATYKQFLIAEYFQIQNTKTDTIKVA